ncbi:hypothetical protein K469DRAFT_702976 [Zopfia rhizophila CBS 207.26]|uniref:Uncharacterized protein n=1 Tax=Zopfia rhizophila CBS 207.26 TaxID=1314779 RepID=A0A6A6D7T4_9PEZI|nr:hypothetical protein K469DRAFT_702976 [Zopfia rhizophila CBS 207.26]
MAKKRKGRSGGLKRLSFLKLGKNKKGKLRTSNTVDGGNSNTPVATPPPTQQPASSEVAEAGARVSDDTQIGASAKGEDQKAKSSPMPENIDATPTTAPLPAAHPDAKIATSSSPQVQSQAQLNSELSSDATQSGSNPELPRQPSESKVQSKGKDQSSGQEEAKKREQAKIGFLRAFNLKNKDNNKEAPPATKQSKPSLLKKLSLPPPSTNKLAIPSSSNAPAQQPAPTPPPPPPSRRTISIPNSFTPSTISENHALANALLASAYADKPAGRPPPRIHSTYNYIQGPTIDFQISNSNAAYVNGHRVIAGVGFRDGKGAVGWSGRPTSHRSYPLNERVNGKKVLASYAHCQDRWQMVAVEDDNIASLLLSVLGNISDASHRSDISLP